MNPQWLVTINYSSPLYFATSGHPLNKGFVLFCTGSGGCMNRHEHMHVNSITSRTSHTSVYVDMVPGGLLVACYPLFSNGSPWRFAPFATVNAANDRSLARCKHVACHTVVECALAATSLQARWSAAARPTTGVEGARGCAVSSRRRRASQKQWCSSEAPRAPSSPRVCLSLIRTRPSSYQSYRSGF